MAAVYKGKLELEKITGIRHDRGQRMSYIPVKQNTTKLPTPEKSIKRTSQTRNGEKY